jgi:predicted transcriptional regulator
MTTITIEVDEDTERRLSELSSGAGISNSRIYLSGAGVGPLYNV